MVRNIPLDKEHESNYLLTSLSPLSTLLSKCTVNTRHAWTWKSNIMLCRISLQNSAANRVRWHSLSHKHTGDRLKLFHAWDNLPAWLRALTDPVGLIPPRATKTGLSPYPTTQCQSAWITYLYHYGTTCSPYAALSSFPESHLHSFPNDLPTAHLVSQIPIFQYS